MFLLELSIVSIVDGFFLVSVSCLLIVVYPLWFCLGSAVLARLFKDGREGSAASLGCWETPFRNCWAFAVPNSDKFWNVSVVCGRSTVSGGAKDLCLL